MNKHQLKVKVDRAIKEVLEIHPYPSYGLSSTMLSVFTKVYGAAPHRYHIGGKQVSPDLPEGFEWENEDSKCMVADKFKDCSIDYWATAHNIMQHYPEAYYIRDAAEAYMFTDTFIMDIPDCSFFSLSYELPKEIEDLVVIEEATPYMSYVTYSNHGFRTISMKVKQQDCDIESNYNDDLPHQQIVDMVNSEESGIAILHGVPGCGKTSYIRKLIADNPNRRFVFLDSSTFSSIGDASFIELLTNNKNSVFVVEDCEDLLVSRDTKGNYKISSLLNLSDGVLGDSLNLKFICTFNADITSIDSALLRKGRLKVKYEFGKLNKEKAQALAAKLGKTEEVTEDMALCEVYNLGVENGGEDLIKSRPKIGFNR